MDFNIILKTLGISGLLLIFAYKLGKLLITHMLSKETEEFKKNLELKTIEHKIRFSSLHEKTALVIAELFAKLVRLHMTLELCIKVSGGSTDTEMKFMVKATEEFIDFEDYFKINSIYMSEELCEKINNFLIKNNEIFSNFEKRSMLAHLMNTDEKYVWNIIEKKFDSEINPIKKDLEKEFRKILGVSSSVS